MFGSLRNDVHGGQWCWWINEKHENEDIAQQKEISVEITTYKP